MTRSSEISDLNSKTSNDTATPNPKQAPTGQAVPAAGTEKRLNQVADHLAHKGAKAEQDFDKDNSNLFNK